MIFQRMLTILCGCRCAISPASHDRDIVYTADPLSGGTDLDTSRVLNASHIDGCMMSIRLVLGRHVAHHELESKFIPLLLL